MDRRRIFFWVGFSQIVGHLSLDGGVNGKLMGRRNLVAACHMVINL